MAEEVPMSAPPRLHLAFLDGLRALAALWVLLFHFDLFEYGLRACPAGAVSPPTGSSTATSLWTCSSSCPASA